MSRYYGRGVEDKVLRKMDREARGPRGISRERLAEREAERAAARVRAINVLKQPPMRQVRQELSQAAQDAQAALERYQAECEAAWQKDLQALRARKKSEAQAMRAMRQAKDNLRERLIARGLDPAELGL